MNEIKNDKYWIRQQDNLEFMKGLESKSVDLLYGEELWKPVLKLYKFNSKWEIISTKEYKFGKYFISNKGRFLNKNKISKMKPTKLGYFQVKIEGVIYKIHQIMMQTFFPEDIKNYYSVDHIDRNPSNNNLENLRWANRSLQYSNRENKLYKYKKILCHQNNKIYNSCQEAEIDLELVKNTVSRVARGDRKSIHGYTFEYI